MKKAIVLTGISGTGKTYARLNDPALRDLPCVDIADVYREFPEFGWLDALHVLLKRVRLLLQKHDAIVIEGYFLPRSTSRTILVKDLKVAGAQVEIHEFWSPFEVCQGRISAQWEVGEISAAECRTRIEMLKRCWTPAPPGVEG
jgi:predicted kinase